MHEEKQFDVRVSVDGLDHTMARSVAAFLETGRSSGFSLADTETAQVALVDLDQPGAREALDKARAPHAIVITISFHPKGPGASHQVHLQKPLTGATLLETLTRATEDLRASSQVAHDDGPTRTSLLQRALRTGSKTKRTRVGACQANAGAVPAGHVVAMPRDEHPRPDITFSASQRIVPVAGHATTADHLAEPLRVRHIDDLGDGDLTDPATRARFTYSPREHFDGCLQDALARGDRHWRVHGPILEVASADGDQLGVSVGPSTVAAACRLSGRDRWTYEALRKPCATAGWHSARRDLLVWDTALWSSAGRLPDTIDPFEPIRLRAWPDLTRCVLAPSTLAVTAFLAHRSIRPVDLPERLGVPASHAFATVAALDAAGLLQDGVPQQTQDPPAAPGPPPKRGLLRRFLDRLRDT